MRTRLLACRISSLDLGRLELRAAFFFARATIGSRRGSRHASQSFIGTDSSGPELSRVDKGRRTLMRMIAKTMIALGFVGTLAAAETAPPAAAQGIYFSGPGVSVGVGRPYHRDHYYRGYRSY